MQPQALQRRTWLNCQTPTTTHCERNLKQLTTHLILAPSFWGLVNPFYRWRSWGPAQHRGRAGCELSNSFHFISWESPDFFAAYEPWRQSAAASELSCSSILRGQPHLGSKGEGLDWHQSDTHQSGLVSWLKEGILQHFLSLRDSHLQLSRSSFPSTSALSSPAPISFPLPLLSSWARWWLCPTPALPVTEFMGHCEPLSFTTSFYDCTNACRPQLWYFLSFVTTTVANVGWFSSTTPLLSCPWCAICLLPSAHGWLLTTEQVYTRASFLQSQVSWFLPHTILVYFFFFQRAGDI